MNLPPDKTTADDGAPARSGFEPGYGGEATRPRPHVEPYPLADGEERISIPSTPRSPAAAGARGGGGAVNGHGARHGGAGDRAARRSRRLPRRPDRLIAWLAVLGCMMVAAVPLSVGLWQPDVLYPLEAEALARSAETWHQQTELPATPWSLEPLVPIENDQPQLSDPPGGTWLHLLAFFAFDAEPNATVEELLHPARLASLVLALLTVAAVFWSAMSIGGLLPATLAGLIAGALPMLLFYGRLAGDSIASVALVTLAVAAAIWALRPLRPANHLVRQALGWSLCGLLLGAATLTGGLVATLAVLVPLVLILVLCPNRLSHALGLIAAVFLGGLVTTPWALHVHEQHPDMWQTWTAALLPADVAENWQAMLQLAGQRLGLLVLMALPWTVWLVAGLLQPFSTSSVGARVRLFIGWVWFVSALLLVLALPGEGEIDEVLFVLPAAVLVVAQVIRQYRDLAAEGRQPRIWTWLCWPHAMVLLVLSVGGPVGLHFQHLLVAEGWLERPLTVPMNPIYWAGIAVCLVLLVGLSLRYMIRRYPGKATVCWALWTMLAFSAVIYPATQGPIMQGEPVIVQRLDTSDAAGADARP